MGRGRNRMTAWNDGFQHLVTYGDDLGVGLEAAFGDYARTWDAGLSATPR